MLDLSGSMYRFNGFDGRLTRECDIATMVRDTQSPLFVVSFPVRVSAPWHCAVCLLMAFKA